MRGPVWLLNATKYGHVDMLDGTGAVAGGILCASSGPFSDKAAYRSFLSGTVVSFINLLLDRNLDELPKLEDPKLVSEMYGVDVVVAHEEPGGKPRHITPSCAHS